ncbi:MAG: hypothetical protein JWR18_1896 [Segetibacter sp.]|jgi:hypothetical protein|nr:hypothetical protein [Segetibacter sp.]
MGARKLYEEKILELIKNIPEEELPKVFSLIEKRNMQFTAVREICGKYSHLPTSSDELSKRKQEEKKLDL